MAGAGKKQEHVRDAAAIIHELRRRRRQDLPPFKRLVEGAIGRFATPWAVVAAVLFIGVWMALHFTLTAHGRPFDSNTFGLLNIAAQLCSLILVIGILVADETHAEIDQERSRLILQMLIVQDRKTSEALKSLEQLLRVQGLQPREGTQKVEDATDLHEAADALREAEQEEQGRTS